MKESIKYWVSSMTNNSHISTFLLQHVQTRQLSINAKV